MLDRSHAYHVRHPKKKKKKTRTTRGRHSKHNSFLTLNWRFLPSHRLIRGHAVQPFVVPIVLQQEKN